MIINPPHIVQKRMHARLLALKALRELTIEGASPKKYFSPMSIAAKVPHHPEFGKVNGSDINGLLSEEERPEEERFVDTIFFQTGNPEKAYQGHQFNKSQSKQLDSQLYSLKHRLDTL
jgi:hypothetical protein